jgi:hypothetical protein
MENSNEIDKRFDEGGDVLGCFDTSKAEVKDPPQEWTPEYVLKTLFRGRVVGNPKDFDEAWKRVADAHNAGLASERVDWSELRDILHLPSTDCDKELVIREIRELASERERIKFLEMRDTKICYQVKCLTDELAAERKRTRQAQKAGRMYEGYMMGKFKTLAEALESILPLAEENVGCEEDALVVEAAARALAGEIVANADDPYPNDL